MLIRKADKSEYETVRAFYHSMIDAIHDRPEGSRLGTYNYIIEVENESGMSGELIKNSKRFLRFAASEVLMLC